MNAIYFIVGDGRQQYATRMDPDVLWRYATIVAVDGAMAWSLCRYCDHDLGAITELLFGRIIDPPEVGAWSVHFMADVVKGPLRPDWRPAATPVIQKAPVTFR